MICDLGEAEEEGEGQHQEGAELKRQTTNYLSHVKFNDSLITWRRGRGLNVNI